MNREQRRSFNKKNKTHFTREQFEIALLMGRLKAGNATEEDIKHARKYIHMDNKEIAPDGCVVKLNYDNIYDRPQEAITEEFKNWVEENKDKEFHLTREGVHESLVSLEEDHRTKVVEGQEVECPRWLFDLYSDLLIKVGEEFKPPYAVDKTMGEYMDAPFKELAEDIAKPQEEDLVTNIEENTQEN